MTTAICAPVFFSTRENRRLVELACLLRGAVGSALLLIFEPGLGLMCADVFAFGVFPFVLWGLCIQCGKCVLVCPHSVIRAKIYEPELLAKAPSGFRYAKPKWKEFEGLRYMLQVAPEDCTGCTLCVQVCPAKSKTEVKHKAINMAPQAPLRVPERENWNFFLSLPEANREQLKTGQVKDVQLLQPLFEFGMDGDYKCIHTAIAVIPPWQKALSCPPAQDDSGKAIATSWMISSKSCNLVIPLPLNCGENHGVCGHDCGENKKNMNPPARHMKNNPAKNPDNHQNQKRYPEDTHRTSRTVGIRGGGQRSRSPLKLTMTPSPMFAHLLSPNCTELLTQLCFVTTP